MPAVTAQEPGNGTGTLSYTIPGNGLDVETVYATVDATGAGGAVTAEITIRDQSGVVIARKVQGSTIDAGVTGSATWALRLDDESAGGTGGGIDFDKFNVGDWLNIETLDTLNNGVRFRNDGDGGTVIRDDGAGGLTLQGNPVDVVGGAISVAGSSLALSSSSGGGGAGSLDEIDVGRPGHATVLKGNTTNAMTIEGGAVGLLSDAGNVSLEAATDIALRPSGTGDVTVLLGIGSVIIYGLTLGDPIFRVDYDAGTDTATYHIRTGAAWVADL